MARVSPPDGSHPRRFSLADSAVCLALLLCTAVTYLRVIPFGFVNFDDNLYVFNNPHLREGFTASGLNWAFTSFDPDNWFPLTRLSHMLDYALFGLNPHWHHGVNILFHALASVMLYGFLRQATYRNTTDQRWPAAFVAAVFALHPLHVESVAWISERKDVLCAFFWFSALWAWVRYTQRPSPGRYLLSLALAAAGLMSKPMIVTLPLLLPVLDLWPLRRPFSRSSFLRQLPFWALSLTASILTLLAQRGVVRTLHQFSLADRLENAVVTVFIYLGKTVWPVGLSLPYPWHRYSPLLALGAAFALIAISLLLLSLRRDRPYLAAGWFWFLITLIPVIGLVQVGAQAGADRYMYVPMVGLLIMAAWGADEILRNLSLRLPWAKPAAAFLAAALCFLFAQLTWAQQQYWEDAPTLFRHAVAVDDQNYLGWYHLGSMATDRATRYECFRIASQIRPDLSDLHVDVAIALFSEKRYAESIAAFEEALRLDPLDPKVRAYLGRVLATTGQTDKAIAQFRLAVRNGPDSVIAANDLAVGLLRTPGDAARAEAIALLEHNIVLQPKNPLAYVNIALALLAVPGRAAAAQTWLIRALAVDPDCVAAHLAMAKVLSAPPSPNAAAAAEHRAAAARLESDPEVLRMLGEPQFAWDKSP